MTAAPWWPWADGGHPPPERPHIELTDQAHVIVLQDRLARVAELVDAALRQHGTDRPPVDVLLDIKLALDPIRLRAPVPIVPGPDAGHG